MLVRRNPICSRNLCAVVSLCFAAQSNGATTILFVDVDSVATSPDGLSWTTAYEHLQDALFDAPNYISSTDDVQIWVAEGVYYPDLRTLGGGLTPGIKTYSFELLEKAAIYGGFEGNEPATTTGFRSRDPYANLTALSGDLDEDDDYENLSTLADNTYHIVMADETNNSAIIDGFVITAGHAVDSGSEPWRGSGGGMVITSDGIGSSAAAQPTVVRCQFFFNYADKGGALYVDGGQTNEPIFTNCYFTLNFALSGDGGAVYGGTGSVACPATLGPGDGSSIKMINCYFWDNQTLVSGKKGGAMFLESAMAAELINCTFRLNSASDGGAIYHFMCEDLGTGVQLNNCILWQNSPDGSDSTLGSDVAQNTCSQDFATGPDSSNNIGQDPDFVSTASSRLQCGSPCINAADATFLDSDLNDVDQDANTSEKTPDLDRNARVVGDGPDMGAFEAQPVASCDGDIAPNPCRNGVVNVDDLLLIINDWGTCDDPNYCPADIAGGSGGAPDGTVDVDDLLEVINNWGDCEEGSSAPSSVGDCFDMCQVFSEIEDWQKCMDGCLQSVCESYPEQCE